MSSRQMPRASQKQLIAAFWGGLFWAILSDSCIAQVGSGGEVTTENVEIVSEGSPADIIYSSSWDRYLMGFRSAHQFLSTCGISEGYWVAKDLGIFPYLERKQTGYFCKAQYTFHLRLVGGFGYFLGSSAGHFITDLAKSEKVKIPNSWQLPSVLGGFVYNFSPSWRATLGLEYYLERFDGIRLRREADSSEIASTAQVTESSIGLEYFFSLKWAAVIRYRNRYLEVSPPEDLSETPLAIGASLKKKDRALTLGLNMHLL